MTRLLSVDILRTLSIVSMILCHFVYFTTFGEGNFQWAYDFASDVLGVWPAAFFVMLSGASFGISLSRKRENNFRPYLTKGLIIFFFAIVFQGIVCGYTRTFVWNILPTIGINLILLFAVRNLTQKQLLSLSIFIFLSSSLIFTYFNASQYWVNGFYYPQFKLSQSIFGFLFAGYFPLFPWCAFAFMGLFCARLIFNHKKNQMPIQIFSFVAAILGVSLHAFSSTTNFSWLVDIREYPSASLNLFFTCTNAFACLLSVLHQIVDRSKIHINSFLFFTTFSRYSLSLYVFHYALVMLAQRMWAMFRGQNDQFPHFMIDLPIPLSFTLGVLAILIFYFVCRNFDRSSGKYSLEWILAKATLRKENFHIEKTPLKKIQMDS